MSFFKFLLFLCANYLTHWSSNALLMEGIVSSNQAEAEDEFTYQAVIFGKKNLTNAKDLLCGAGVIAADKVLTAAQCFIDEHGNHKEFTFSVTANVNDITSAVMDDILIDLIYLVKKETYIKSDISVALLVEPFNFANNPRISTLDIPKAGKRFEKQVAFVAGHGYNTIRRLGVRRYEGSSDGLLRYMRVRIPIIKDCIYRHGLTDDYGVVCAKPLDVPQGEKWGFCQHDTGSPLVINNVVIAVASSSHEDCDDTSDGGMYTSVPHFQKFIEQIVHESPLSYTIIYPNRPHHLE